MQPLSHLLLSLVGLRLCLGCSFLIANFDVDAEVLHRANFYNQRRGPDVTNVLHSNGWTFLHNLLSITGPRTIQPFVSENSQQYAVFNGEVYNYPSIAKRLTGSSVSFSSDGQAILPAYSKWGTSFTQRFHGEWSIALVDIAREITVLSTDAFGTKPLWYAVWGTDGRSKFAAASVKSALLGLGAPSSSCMLAEPNQILVLDAARAHSITSRLYVVEWDLNQHKNHSSDWVSAFRHAVHLRSRNASLNAAGLLYMGLSSGYDSGAIALALHLQGTPYSAYSYINKGTGEKDDVVDARAKINLRHGGTQTELIMTQAQMEEEQSWMWNHTEPYAEVLENGRQRIVWDDLYAHYSSYVARHARQQHRLVALQSNGADEVINDYSMHGKYTYGPNNQATRARVQRSATAECGCFHGQFPDNLSTIFPWCDFYHGCQRHNLLREEYGAGAHGVETRYPFLDVNVVQEFLWMTPALKMSVYKGPIAVFLHEHEFPNAWDFKQGYSAGNTLRIPGSSRKRPLPSESRDKSQPGSLFFHRGL